MEETADGLWYSQKRWAPIISGSSLDKLVACWKAFEQFGHIFVFVGALISFGWSQKL